jgi:2-polyprenyl-6-methoxyphenol hydroxylase-like FAD-dependent oxidoreductase
MMVSWDLLYFVLRAAFDNEKSEYCEVPTRRQGDGSVRYEYGHRVVGISDLGDKGMEVEFELTANDKGGDSEGQKAKKKEKADLVVAADGASSTVRKILLPEVERR